MLQETEHKESLVSLGHSELKLIPSQDFKDMLFKNSNFTSKFLKELAYVASNLELNLVEMAYSSVRRKVARALLSFVESSEESGVLSLTVSRENLAAAAGTAKETLIRTLSDFKDEKLIDIEGRSILILDKVGLESMPQ